MSSTQSHLGASAMAKKSRQLRGNGIFNPQRVETEHVVHQSLPSAIGTPGAVSSLSHTKQYVDSSQRQYPTTTKHKKNANLDIDSIIQLQGAARRHSKTNLGVYETRDANAMSAMAANMNLTGYGRSVSPTESLTKDRLHAKARAPGLHNSMAFESSGFASGFGLVGKPALTLGSLSAFGTYATPTAKHQNESKDQLKGGSHNQRMRDTQPTAFSNHPSGFMEN